MTLITKSQVPSTLRPYVGHNFNYGTFNSDCGPNEEAKSFCRKFINYVHKAVPHTDGKLKANYYCVSGALKRPDGQWVYVAIGDIRYWQDEWAEKILIRTMKHNKDWTGGMNHFTTIDRIAEDIERLR